MNLPGWVWLLAIAGPRYGGEFFAGWITEYSLSVDNLFVLIMSSFAVPRARQQKVLSVGIILALALRGVFIAAGARSSASPGSRTWCSPRTRSH